MRGHKKKGAIAKGKIKPENKAINLGCKINFCREGIVNPNVESKKKAS